jgi:hypothetical protein
MNNVFGRPLIREGKESIELSADDLNDRIINLKFTRKSGRSFAIRSDYEPVYHNNGGAGTVSFKRCVQKPDIKVTYKQVAESVAIEVDIEVTNLFIGDGDKEDPESINSSGGDPVEWCVIQMGYRAQFPDWTKPERTVRAERFWDLNNNAITSEAEVRRGREILVQILTGYAKSYPPDKVTYFKGIIGNMEKGLRWNHDEEELVQGYGEPDFPKDLSWLEEILFQFVTRRFIRPGVEHRVETRDNLTNKEAMEQIQEKKYEQKIWIYGYDQYEEVTGTPTDRMYAALVMREAVLESEKKWEYQELLIPGTGPGKGLMSITDAVKFGVICAVSRTLHGMAAPLLPGHGLDPEEEADIEEMIPAMAFDDMQDTLGGQLVTIQAHFPFLRWYQLTDGSFFFYHVDDKDEDLWSDPFVKRRQRDNIVALPAIYDMTSAGTRTIRCPFISFLDPMMTVLFQSRFSIGTLVSYFYPPKTNAFLVIISAVEFATVQDVNTMELMCVDLPPQEVEVDEETEKITVRGTEEDDNTPTIAKMQQERSMRWIEQQLTVTEHKFKTLDTSSRWEDIVYYDVLPNVRPDRWPEGAEVTEKEALEALIEWNPEYFDRNGKYASRGNSLENGPAGIGGRNGVFVPILEVGDKIIIRHPFQPEYPER